MFAIDLILFIARKMTSSRILHTFVKVIKCNHGALLDTNVSHINAVKEDLGIRISPGISITSFNILLFHQVYLFHDHSKYLTTIGINEFDVIGYSPVKTS